MKLSSADQTVMDVVAIIGIDYEELCEFHEAHYEHTNIWAIEEVMNDDMLRQWVNSLEIEEVNQLSPWERMLASEPLEPWQQQCMGYEKTYTSINVSYVDTPDGPAKHEVGDTYTFTMEERNNQYADISGLSNMPVHIENLLNAA